MNEITPNSPGKWVSHVVLAVTLCPQGSCTGCGSNPSRAVRSPQRAAQDLSAGAHRETHSAGTLLMMGNTLLSPAESLNSVLAPLFQGTATNDWMAPPEERRTFKCVVTSWDVRVLFSLADLICSISGNKGGLSQ